MISKIFTPPSFGPKIPPFVKKKTIFKIEIERYFFFKNVRLSKIKYTYKSFVLIIMQEHPQKWDFSKKRLFRARRACSKRKIPILRVFYRYDHYETFTSLFYFWKTNVLKKLVFYLDFENWGSLTNCGISGRAWVGYKFSKLLFFLFFFLNWSRSIFEQLYKIIREKKGQEKHPNIYIR